MKAREIEDCNDCPLNGTDHCSGGVTSSPGGYPIEPPCCNWSPEDEIILDEYEDRKEESIKYYELTEEDKKNLEETYKWLDETFGDMK